MDGTMTYGPKMFVQGVWMPWGEVKSGIYSFASPLLYPVITLDFLTRKWLTCRSFYDPVLCVFSCMFLMYWSSDTWLRLSNPSPLLSDRLHSRLGVHTPSRVNAITPTAALTAGYKFPAQVYLLLWSSELISITWCLLYTYICNWSLVFGREGRH